MTVYSSSKLQLGALLAVYGSESDTNWFMGRIAQWVYSAEEAAAIRPTGAFKFAALLTALNAPDSEQRVNPAATYTIAVQNINTVRDLEA